MKWFHKRPATTADHRPGRIARATFRPELEVLEARELLSVGGLDLGFGGSGHVATPFALDAEARAVAIQPNDGRIVVAGLTGGAAGIDFALARYLPDGKPDTSFSFDGKTTTDFGAYDGAFAVAIQNDGKIVAAGVTFFDNHSSLYQIALARYNNDGSLDHSFGPNHNGMIVDGFTDTFGLAFAMALQNDGGVQKIVVAGAAETLGFYKAYFGLARYNPDGSRDWNFGSQGTALTHFGAGFAMATSLSIDGSGTIVAAGMAGGTDDFDLNSGNVAVARYHANGTADTSFGTMGRVVTPVGSWSVANAVAVQNNGNIVVAGTSEGGNNDSDFLLARYLPEGNLDHDFDGDGLVFTDFGGTTDEARAVFIQGNRILVAGQHFELARYRPDGSLDPQFGTGGKVVSSFANAKAFGAALQDDGKIVIVGRVKNGIEMYFFVARYNTEFIYFDISKLGNILFILASLQPDQLNIIDRGRGDVTLYSPREDTAPFTLHGIRRIVVQTFGGNDVVTYRLENPAAHVDSLWIDLGQGNDRFLFDAPRGYSNPDKRRSHIHVGADAGDDEVTFRFGGPIMANLDLDIRLGAGRDQFLLEALAGWDSVGRKRSLVRVLGGPGHDEFMVRLDPLSADVVFRLRGQQGQDDDDELEGPLDRFLR